MASRLSRGGAFLQEILAFGENTGSRPLQETAATPVAQGWRQAVSGGASDLFSRRLTAEGLTESEALARLQRGLCCLSQETPQWLLLLRRVVPERAVIGEVPRLLTEVVLPKCRRVFAASLFSLRVPAAIAQQLETHCRQLLEVAAVNPTAGAWEAFEERPFLARLLATRVNQWLRSCRTLAQRLQRDRLEIEQSLLGGRSLQVTELTFGLSDRHQEGETVARLVSAPGLAFFYKPRSLEPERVLAVFFDALRPVGITLPPLPEMVARSRYGWVAEVSQASLLAREQVQRWFFTAGHLAAVAWLLGLSDLHWENVVAGEDGPVVVDGETWCRPLTVFDPKEDSDILASGLVTFPMNGPSGLRDDGAFLGGHRPGARSLPLFAGQPVDPCQYREEIVAGARDALEKLLWAWRSGQLRLPFNELSRLQVRWVARPSEAYASFFRSALQNSRVRECWQLSVLAETRWRGPLAAGMDIRALVPFLRAETLALHSFAVPRLTLPAARRCGVVRRSGQQQILLRLRRLDHKFIKHQLAVLTASLHSLREGPRAGLRQAASEVAAALRQGEAALGLEVGPFLRRGWAGWALAWAAWARASGDATARQRARQYLERLQGELQGGIPGSWLPGYASGFGGVVYAFFACGCWLEEPTFCELARGLAKEALGRSEPLEHLDVEAGVAGLLLGVAETVRGLPELHEALESGAASLLAAVQGAAANGGKSIWKPGFAHGISGVAAALLRVAEATGNRRWAREAVWLLEREPRAGTWWAEAELPAGETVSVGLNGWCHGPAGALAARKLVPAELGTPHLARQNAEAYARLIPLKLSSPLSLCCGSIGRSEISLIIGELAGDERLMDEATKLAALLFSSGLWRRELDPKGGLFDGLPGFLFHLSRLLLPGQLGSVLVGGVEGAKPWT